MDAIIPIYLLREWHRHYRRIVDNAVFDPSDTSTANAFRLAKKDLCKLDEYIRKAEIKERK